MTGKRVQREGKSCRQAWWHTPVIQPSGGGDRRIASLDYIHSRNKEVLL
jgi:hypothetical protein